MPTTVQRSEHYTDRGHYAVMTRTTVLKEAKLSRIADHLCRNAEDLVFSTNPRAIDNRCIAATMLGWAYNLAPLRIGTRFDY
ncbi:MAG: hypothetical protein ACLPY1_07290 [Terracidiphilus sp.]